MTLEAEIKKDDAKGEPIALGDGDEWLLGDMGLFATWRSVEGKWKCFPPGILSHPRSTELLEKIDSVQGLLQTFDGAVEGDVLQLPSEVAEAMCELIYAALEMNYNITPQIVSDNRLIPLGVIFTAIPPILGIKKNELALNGSPPGSEPTESIPSQ